MIPIPLWADECKNYPSNIRLYIYTYQLSCIFSLDACIASLNSECSYKCGPVYQGTTLVIPCGHYNENTTTLFTYRNRSVTFISNTTMFLRKHTTSDDNNKKIYCKLHDGESYCYLLNIHCKSSS